MKDLIDQYEKGAENVQAAIKGLSSAELRRAPDPAWNAGKWTIAQVLVHLQDAETAFADRVRRIIAHDNPPLLAWDENRFVERLHYEAQSGEDAAELIILMRRQLARVLRELSDADFQRAGEHNEAGRQTVDFVLGKAVWHLDHHLKFIRDKRTRFGK
jgi:DinB superfamily